MLNWWRPRVFLHLSAQMRVCWEISPMILCCCSVASTPAVRFVQNSPGHLDRMSHDGFRQDIVIFFSCHTTNTEQFRSVPEFEWHPKVYWILSAQILLIFLLPVCVSQWSVWSVFAKISLICKIILIKIICRYSS